MKTPISLLFATILFTASTQAQFSENFDQNISGLPANCWLINQFNYTTTSGDVINGTGSAYTNPPTSSSGIRSISTPFLNMNSTSLSVSFLYKISSTIAGNATRTINIGIVNNSGVFTSLQTITLDNNTPTAVQSLSSTYTLASTGIYRLELRVGGATGDGNSRVIFDDLNISASPYYGPINHCNPAGIAVDDTYNHVFVEAVSGNVMANDQFPADNETYSPVVVAAPASGTLVLNADGSFTYTPAASFTGGVITFTYQLLDNGYSPSLSNIATVTINYPAPVLLPVLLRDFTASLNTSVVELKWVVDFNIDGKYYEIEKSTDGKQFTVIGRVPANDHSNKYSFYDNDISGDAFYRLIIYNTDNSKSVSKTVFVKGGEEVSQIKVYGTNVTSVLRFGYASTKKMSSNVQVYSINGQKVIDETMNIEAGKNDRSISVQKLNPGGYILVINSGNKKGTARFVKR